MSYYKYLGVTVSCRNKWTKNVETLVAQSTKVNFQLNRYLKALGVLPYHVFFKLFNTIVLPTVCYGSEIWGFQEYYLLNNMHAKLCKRFLGLSPKAMNIAALGECGQTSIFVQTANKCVKYWFHLLNLDNNRYPKQVYNMLFYYDECNRKNWVSEIKDLLCRSGFGHVWYFQGVGNENVFIQSFKERLMYVCIYKHGVLMYMTVID